MEKITKKIDKTISITYWSLIGLNLILFSWTYFKYGYLIEGVRSTFFVTLLSLPLFIVFTILYKIKYKEKIIKDKRNNFINKIKYTGLIIFFTAVITVSLIGGLSKDEIAITQIFRDSSHFIWPFLLLLFAINYTIKKDENYRYKNLKYLLLNLIFFAILIPFCGLFGTILFDGYIVLVMLITH